MAQDFFTLNRVQFPINKRVSKFIPDVPQFTEDQESLDLAEKILKGAEKNMPVLLVGPTGSGKTATVKWLSYKTNNSYRRVQLNGSTGVDTFIGKWLLEKDGTVWVDGVLTDAMRHGHWLLLDELNAALPEILFVLHSVMDDDKRLILDDKDGELVTAHPDFRIFATMNPSEGYAGTKELNRALFDRFPITINVGYPNTELEEKIIFNHSDLDFNSPKHTKLVDRMIEFAHISREKYDNDELLYPVSTRQLINWAKLITYFGVKTAAKITVLSKADDEIEREKLKAEIDKFFRDDEDAPEGFSTEPAPEQIQEENVVASF